MFRRSRQLDRLGSSVPPRPESDGEPNAQDPLMSPANGTKIPAPTIDDVVNAVARRFEVSPSGVRGQDRSPKVSAARHVALLIGWRILGKTQTEVAEAFGRGHSGVAYAAQKAIELLVKDKDVYARASEVLGDLGFDRHALPVVGRGEHHLNSGLVALHPTTAGELSFFLRVPDAKQLDLAMTTGSHLIDALRNDIETAIERGCRMRLALANPDTIRDQPQSYFCDSDVEDLLDWSFAQLNAIRLGLAQRHATGSLEVRLLPGPTTCGLILIDDAVARWTPLLPMRDSKASPSLDFLNTEGSVYSQLRDAFETMWAQSEPHPDSSYNTPAASHRRSSTRGRH